MHTSKLILLSQHVYCSKFSSDIQIEFDRFYSYLYDLLNSYYPERTITTTSSEPSFMTPALKAVLRRNDRLMRTGRTNEASALARRIGRIIRRHNILPSPTVTSQIS